MNLLYDRGLITESSLFEFLHSHTSVIFQPEFDDRRYYGLNPYALGFAMMSDIRRVCEARPLASLGRISYGFYVLHAPVVALLRKHWAPSGSLADCLGFFTAALVVSTVLATASWFGFERPLLRLRPRGSFSPVLTAGGVKASTLEA